MKTKRRERGEGAIRLLSDGRFEARVSLGFDADGKRVRKRLYGETINQVQLKVGRERTKTKAQYHLDASRITLGAFIEEWLETEVRANTRLATYRLREATCRNHIVPFLGSLRLSDIEPSHVRGLLRNLRAAGVGAR